MFSSILPNASSSAKFVQNGHPKTPSRFSVRVFKTPVVSAFPYPMTAKVDLGYRSAQQPEQQRYFSSNHNISYDARLRNNSYAIYPGALSDVYIYEQSTCSKSDIFSNSDYDALSTATFSPAMSTDSTLTLRSPATPEHFLEERSRRPATPAAPSNYAAHGSMAPQPPIISRTTSNHHAGASVDTANDRRPRVTSMQGHSTPIRAPISSASLNELTRVSSNTTGYNGQLPSHIPEYAPSTISDFEVEQRDRIAKINAEYNSVSSSSSSSYYSNNGPEVAIEPNVRRSTPPTQPSRDTFTQVTSSQPLHPNLQFPIKPDDFNPTFDPNPTPFIFSTKGGSPPLVERVPSRVQFPSANTPSSQPLPAQAQDDWNRNGGYYPTHTRVPGYHPPPPVTPNHLFDNGHTSLPRSTQTTYATSQETMNLNEYRPLPVPPPEVPHQRSMAERRPSVTGPRPEANVLKSTPNVRRFSQIVKEYPYDHSELRRDVSNSPPRGSTLQTSSQDPSRRAAMASEMRRDTRTPAPREHNDYRSAPPVRHNSYLADVQNTPVEPRSQTPHPIDTHKPPPLTPSPTQLRLSPSELEASKPPARAHLQPATFVEPTRPEGPSDRSRSRSSSFSNSTRPNLPPVNNLSQPRSSPKQFHASNSAMPEPRRVSEQDSHVRLSPPRMQEAPAYHSDYVEERRNDVRGPGPQAMYGAQPIAPTFNRDAHASQHQNLATGQSPPKSNDRASPYPVVNSRNATQDVPSSRSKSSYAEVPAAHGLSTRDSTPYEKSSVKHGNIGGYSSSSNSSDQGFVLPEQAQQRRYSDGDQNPPPRSLDPSSGRSSAPLVRSVRWTENLICPSPVLTRQRRKGWFNRRGDQLWTNDGVYKPPSVGQEYPQELDDYPEHGEGWMNEETIRIDMGHRLVPKPPLRSALKQTK